MVRQAKHEARSWARSVVDTHIKRVNNLIKDEISSILDQYIKLQEQLKQKDKRILECEQRFIQQEIVLAHTSNHFSCVDIDYEGKSKREAEIIKAISDPIDKQKAIYKYSNEEIEAEEQEALRQAEEKIREVVFEKPFNFYSFAINLQNEQKSDICKNYIIDCLKRKNTQIQKELDRRLHKDGKYPKQSSTLSPPHNFYEFALYPLIYNLHLQTPFPTPHSHPQL